MKIAVIGTGYVGLVTSACLADSGNDVVGIDVDKQKIDVLNSGGVPIYEPGLEELIERNRDSGRLQFTTDYAAGVPQARIVFIAVGTPETKSASREADLKYVWSATDQVAAAIGKAPVAPGSKVVVVKSTVPVGTNRTALERMVAAGCKGVDVANNPEFLKEGAALDDFQKPDRVVVGVRRPEVAEILRELYGPFLRTEHPFLVMSPESAELTKYAANAMLATKISFINQIANLCDRLGADVNDVRRGIGHDARIGFQFLFPGPGYGGSCFPKLRYIDITDQVRRMPVAVVVIIDQLDMQDVLAAFTNWGHMRYQITQYHWKRHYPAAGSASAPAAPMGPGPMGPGPSGGPAAPGGFGPMGPGVGGGAGAAAGAGHAQQFVEQPPVNLVELTIYGVANLYEKPKEGAAPTATEPAPVVPPTEPKKPAADDKKPVADPKKPATDDKKPAADPMKPATTPKPADATPPKPGEATPPKPATPAPPAPKPPAGTPEKSKPGV